MRRFEEALVQVKQDLTERSLWSNERYSFHLIGPALSVRDLTTGELVAYSEMQADLNQSLEEFVWDFGGVS